MSRDGTWKQKGGFGLPRPFERTPMAEYNREQAKADAIVVLQNLIEQLRLHHGVPSKSDARAIIREAIMEL